VMILGTWKIAIRTEENMGPFTIGKPNSAGYSVSGRLWFFLLFCISRS
jgi:hypothetical protein